MPVSITATTKLLLGGSGKNLQASTASISSVAVSTCMLTCWPQAVKEEMLLLMFQNCGNHHLGCMEPCNQWDKLSTGAGFLPSTVWHTLYQLTSIKSKVHSNNTNRFQRTPPMEYKILQKTVLQKGRGVVGNYRQGHVGDSKIGHRRNYPIPLYSLVDIWVPTRGYSTLRNERGSIIPFYKTQPAVAVLFFTVFRSGPVPWDQTMGERAWSVGMVMTLVKHWDI